MRFYFQKLVLKKLKDHIAVLNSNRLLMCSFWCAKCISDWPSHI